ncbi:MAG: hypothetical protein Q8O63_10835, partial [Hoeflea sp.]|nr:hypothetical protein [Hoeflea sp.]
FADLEPLGDQLLDRAVGLVVFRHGPDPRLEPDRARRILDQPVDRVRGRRRRQTNGEIDSAVLDFEPAAQMNIGAIEVARKMRTK